MTYANTERKPWSSVWMFEIPPLLIWQKMSMTHDEFWRMQQYSFWSNRCFKGGAIPRRGGSMPQQVLGPERWLWGRVLSRGRNMLAMIPMPMRYHHSYPNSKYGYRKHLTSAYGNQPQWYSHQVRTLPGHMWYPCQLVKKVDIAVKSGTWWKVASATKGNRKCTANKEWATLKWMW